MFVAASKLLDLALEPLWWCLALLAAGLAASALGRRRAATACLGLTLAALLVFGSGGTARRLTAWTEGPARATFRPEVTYDAAIVLSGGVDDEASRRSGELELNAAGDRVVRAFELLRSGRARRVLLTGGPVEPPPPGEPSEVSRVGERLVAWGIAPERIVLEDRSRNTRENAVESARIASERGWRSVLLVTSAAHMPRALASFRKAGLSPDALPVDHRARADAGEGWLPRAAALRESTEALRELAGRVVYRLMGYG